MSNWVRVDCSMLVRNETSVVDEETLARIGNLFQQVTQAPRHACSGSGNRRTYQFSSPHGAASVCVDDGSEMPAEAMAAFERIEHSVAQ